MKNFGKLFGIISIITIIVCAMAACDFLDLTEPDKTPVAGDYDIGNLKQAAGGTIAAVTVTPKSGKSSGARTIYYEGTGNTVYAKSTTVPATSTSVVTYAVTFDVAAASGWSAATGLFAGVLTIGTPTPVAGDYEVNGLAQKFGSVTAVTITPKAGKSNGARTIYYEGTSGTTYTKSITLPSAKGTYAVTFDVAAASGWNAAAGLSAGNLVINDNPTPVASDYNFGNLTQSADSVTAVTITPKAADKSGGARTIYYTGANGTTYAKSTTPPTAAGTYAVTFDVAAASGWNPATGLSAGTLTVTAARTLSVTILGDPAFGKMLTVDVQKNFSGKVEYLWLRDGVAIYDEVFSEFWYRYWINLTDTGKNISVKVKCEGKTVESPAVTIQSLEYKLSQSLDEINVLVKEDDDWWELSEYYYEDFKVQWVINDTLSSQEGWIYILNPGDGGKNSRGQSNLRFNNNRLLGCDPD